MKNRHPHFFRILLLLCCLALAATACRSVEESDGTSVATIKVTPADTTMKTGDLLQLSAARLYTNSSSEDCSDGASWTSSDTAVASFSSTTNGLLSASTAGTTTISVTCSGTSKSYTMTVTSAATLQSIEISPLDMSIAPSSSVNLIATGVYSDGSTADLTDAVNWSSATPTSISVERSSGSDSIQATGQTAGTTVTITAEYAGVSGTSSMAVKAVTVTPNRMFVTPVNPTLGVGARLFLKAAIKYNVDNSVQEATDSVAWSVTSGAAATVSSVNKGLARGIAAGSETVTATKTASDSTVITVGSATLDSIEVYPKTLSMAVNTFAQLTAIGIYSDNSTVDLTDLVTWNSSNTSIVSVATSHRYLPRVKALAEGNAFINASLPGSSKGAGVSVAVARKTLSSIEVTPSGPTIPPSMEFQFKATGIFSDSSTQDLTQSVVWSSSNKSVVLVSNGFHNKGEANTTSTGGSSATITATFGSTSGTSSVSVSNATLSTMNVTPAGVSLPNGYKQQFKATALYSDGSSFDLTPYVAWTSSSTDLITPNIKPWQGVAASRTSIGTPNVVAEYFGPKNNTSQGSGSTAASMSSATLSSIEIAPTNTICMEGLDINFTATGIFSDSTTLDMTPFVVWKSSSTSVATPGNLPGSNGKFHCVSSGEATVTAASGTTSGTTTLYVADQ